MLGAQLITVSTVDNSEVDIAVVLDRVDQGLLTTVKDVIENANNAVDWQFVCRVIVTQVIKRMS